MFTYDEDDERWIWGDYNFSGVNLERANLEGIVWQQIKLCGVNLRGANFYMAILFGSYLSDSNCESAKFMGANLEEVNFTGANLKNADFTINNLGGFTKLSGANFIKAILDGAKFGGATYNARRIFPKNFNPEQNGLTRIKIPIE